MIILWFITVHKLCLLLQEFADIKNHVVLKAMIACDHIMFLTLACLLLQEFADGPYAVELKPVIVCSNFLLQRHRLHDLLMHHNALALAKNY